MEDERRRPAGLPLWTLLSAASDVMEGSLLAGLAKGAWSVDPTAAGAAKAGGLLLLVKGEVIGPASSGDALSTPVSESPARPLLMLLCANPCSCNL